FFVSSSIADVNICLLCPFGKNPGNKKHRRDYCFAFQPFSFFHYFSVKACKNTLIILIFISLRLLSFHLNKVKFFLYLQPLITINIESYDQVNSFYTFTYYCSIL